MGSSYIRSLQSGFWQISDSDTFRRLRAWESAGSTALHRKESASSSTSIWDCSHVFYFDKRGNDNPGPGFSYKAKLFYLESYERRPAQFFTYKAPKVIVVNGFWGFLSIFFTRMVMTVLDSRRCCRFAPLDSWSVYPLSKSTQWYPVYMPATLRNPYRRVLLLVVPPYGSVRYLRSRCWDLIFGDSSGPVLSHCIWLPVSPALPSDFDWPCFPNIWNHPVAGV